MCGTCTNSIAYSVYSGNSASNNCPYVCQPGFYRSFELMMFENAGSYPFYFYTIPWLNDSLSLNWTITRILYLKITPVRNCLTSFHQSYVIASTMLNPTTVARKYYLYNNITTYPPVTGARSVASWASLFGSVQWVDASGSHFTVATESNRLFRGVMNPSGTAIYVQEYLAGTSITCNVQNHAGTKVYFTRDNAAVYVADNNTNVYSTVTTTSLTKVTGIAISSLDSFLIVVDQARKILRVNLTTSETIVIASSTSTGYVD